MSKCPKCGAVDSMKPEEGSIGKAIVRCVCSKCGVIEFRMAETEFRRRAEEFVKAHPEDQKLGPEHLN